MVKELVKQILPFLEMENRWLKPQKFLTEFFETNENEAENSMRDAS